MASLLANNINGNKRKALGDITNRTNLPRENATGIVKKPSLTSNSVASNPPSNAMDIVRTSQPPPAPVADRSNRVYMNRPCDDIDSRDSDNPLLVASCVNEMYENFGNLEQQFQLDSNYMNNQEFINEKMRAILTDWLVEVHLKFKMVPESLYITVQILDRYLQRKSVRRSRLQLVGVAALLVAAKYEEIFAPQLKELVYITDKAYSKQDILEMENDIIQTLDFNFTVPNIHTFLCRFLKAAHADREMVQISCYLTERSLQEYSLLKYLPSQVAAAAVMVARISTRRHPWSPTLLKYTGYDEGDLTACAADMSALFNDAENQLLAVFRKYSSTKYGETAKMSLQYTA